MVESGKKTHNTFIGRYYHRLEAKGRVSLPVKFRERLQTGSVLTRGLDGCLAIFDQVTWGKKLSEIENLSQTKKAHRDYIRFVANDAVELEIDGQGRIRIEENLQELGHLQKDVVIVGSLDHIEIWDKETYHNYLDNLEKNIESTVEQISNGI